MINLTSQNLALIISVLTAICLTGKRWTGWKHSFLCGRRLVYRRTCGFASIGGRQTFAAGKTTREWLYDRNFKDNRNIADSEKCVLFWHTPARFLTNKDEIIIYPKRLRRADNIQKSTLTQVFI